MLKIRNQQHFKNGTVPKSQRSRKSKTNKTTQSTKTNKEVACRTNVTTRGIIPGITGYISAPCTYTVNYLNGSQTYTEKFAVINIGSQYTGAASKEIDVIMWKRLLHLHLPLEV